MINSKRYDHLTPRKPCHGLKVVFHNMAVTPTRSTGGSQL